MHPFFRQPNSKLTWSKMTWKILYHIWYLESNIESYPFLGYLDIPVHRHTMGYLDDFGKYICWPHMHLPGQQKYVINFDKLFGGSWRFGSSSLPESLSGANCMSFGGETKSLNALGFEAWKKALSINLSFWLADTNSEDVSRGALVWFTWYIWGKAEWRARENLENYFIGRCTRSTRPIF